MTIILDNQRCDFGFAKCSTFSFHSANASFEGNEDEEIWFGMEQGEKHEVDM